MQINTSLPELLPSISPISKAITVAGLGLGALLLSKLGRRGPAKAQSVANLPHRSNEAPTNNFPSLKEAAHINSRFLGNKAFHLSNLLALGFDIPAGFVVITSAYDGHIKQCGAESLIDQLYSRQGEDIAQLCDEIKQKIESHPVSAELMRAIELFFDQRQGTLGVAVRSSSNQEDSTGKAFAGQFDTYLNVKTPAEVAAAVKKVWSSLWSPHVITYQRSMASHEHSPSLNDLPKMAVVVQVMVDSYVSGVAFTANPMGTADEMMIESYFGQGEMVVAGEVSPDQFIVAKNSAFDVLRSKINLAKQSVAFAEQSDGSGLNVKQLPKDLETAVSLSEERVKIVARLALNVEQAFACPQDIEFAWDKQGKLYLLQARPITTNNWQQKFSFLREWKAPGPGSWALEGVHTSQPMSKMWFTVYPPNQTLGMRRSARLACSPIEYIEHQEVNGFVYFCLRFVGAPADAQGPPPKFIFKLLQRFHPAIRERFSNAENVFKDKVCRKDMEFWRKEDKLNCYNRNIALAAVDRASLSDEELWNHYQACFNNAAYMVEKHHFYTFTSMLPLQDFLSHLKYTWGLDINKGIGIVRGTAPIGSGVEEYIADEVFKAFQQDSEALLLLDRSDLHAAEVIEALKARQGPIGQTVKKYITQAGYRLANGYDVVQQTVIEQPALLLYGLKKTYAYGAGVLPPSAPNQSEIDELRNQVPEKDRALFDELLAEAQFMHPLRDERSMYGDMMGVGLLRHAMLEIGQRLVNRNILSNKELAVEADPTELETLFKLKGPSDDTVATEKLFAERRLYRKSVSTLDVPQFLRGTPAKLPPLDWFPKHTHRLIKCVAILTSLMFDPGHNPVEKIIADKKLIGAPGAKGVVEGTVKVIRHVDTDREKFQPGDILVTYNTSSALCMLLSQSSAVIAEEGGALTHAAITARELNIPAVVACKGVMQTLRDGMRVRVNGSTGEVFILDQDPVSLSNSA